jgi:hypothetical protein
MQDLAAQKQLQVGEGMFCCQHDDVITVILTLLDFEMFKAKHLTVYTSSVHSKWFASSGGRTLYIEQVITKCKLRNIGVMLLVYIPVVLS